ncbi:MAG: M20/M25/M40 family metallo-hydrolase [Planctomycetales bacterium]|nr:M20/M25/M40 family metallo-hydrolase [Planctomycetales bacterium]
MSDPLAAVIELAQQLIAIPSPSPMRPRAGTDRGEGAMIEYLMAWSEQRGFEASVVGSSPGAESLTVWLPGNPDRGLFLLDAHLDTVPAGDWKDAFQGQVVEGRLLGRGACDVKGPMAVMLVTLERLSRLPESERPSVLFVGSADEEFGQAGVSEVVARWQESPPAFSRGRELRGVIVAEPTELHPVVAHHGVLRWTASTIGQAAHSSRPELGVNAIHAMSHVVGHWEQYAHRLETADRVHPLCGGPRTSIGVIRGGSAVNIVPALCEIEIDRRVAPTETIESAWREVMAELKQVGDIQVESSEPWCVSLPLDDSANHGLAQAICERVQRLGVDAMPIGVSFGTHAPRYQALGVPVVVWGPGSIAQAHTLGEWIDLGQLELASEALYSCLSDADFAACLSLRSARGSQ